MATETKGRFGIGSGILFLLFLLGIVLAVYRWATGLQSVSNLNQGYPWGLWIGFDILAGIALAAGGFVVAGTVHIFGGEKYHPLVRPAIVTALLGYLMFIGGLLVDLGRPWMIWDMIIWHHHGSPMFEVGWCVMLYTTVLVLEFLPILFERYNKTGAVRAWMNVMPWVAIALLVLFAIVMTHSTPWVLAIAAVLVILEILILAGVVRRDRTVPTLLIMAGIIFSTLHQSSLGTLFVMVPHKLSAIWYSPLLPALFFVSAVMAGLAMVVVESTFTAKFFGRGLELELLQGLGKALSWAILFYLALRGLDLVIRGVGPELLAATPQSIWFWIEVVVGLLIPLAILLTPEFASSGRGLYWASLMVVAGVILNRMNVAVTGIAADYWKTYYPAWSEVAISVGIVSLGILVYVWLCRNFPILGREHAHSAKA
jgi:Ni/Fe-hydrogenase subunit HybB-like protein